MSSRVVVTGLGTVNALAWDVDQLWQALLEGRSGVGTFENFDVSEFAVRFGGEVKNFDPAPYLDAKQSRRLDRFAQFALVAACRAVEQSGLDFSVEDPYRCGVIIGSGIGGLSEFETQYDRMIRLGVGKISPLMIPKLMVNAASGQVSIRFGLMGVNSAVATACASSANAIGDAFKAIQRGAADVIITGGSEAGCTAMGLGGFCSLKALSRRNDDPAAASRPFDAQRDGFVLSEGAGIIVLESEAHAKKRGANIHAEMLGYGSSSDGSHMTAPDPEGNGGAMAMKQAVADAGICPEQIDYINAHGTSTPLGDRAETVGIKKMFGEHAYKLAISSTKSQLGHLLGASGGVEMIAVVKSLLTNTVHPTINHETPDPDCDLDYVPNTAREIPVRYALTNSFGFGGHNACLVLGKYGLNGAR